MQSLWELEDAMIDWLVGTKHQGQTSKYEALVQSSLQMGGNGCDGLILTEVERAAEKRLIWVADEDLRGIWEETENGQMSIAEGYDDPDRFTMIPDIVIDLIQAIAERVCAEAEVIAKKREKQRKANQRKLNASKPGIAIAAPEDVCPDFAKWPESWQGIKKDLPYGRELLDAMRPFVVDLIAQRLKKPTIRKHMNNLWLLGGEIIRDISTDRQYSIPPLTKLRESVRANGGPLCRDLDSEEAQNAFDATCRKLHKFLEAKP